MLQCDLAPPKKECFFNAINDKGLWKRIINNEYILKNIFPKLTLAQHEIVFSAINNNDR